MYKTYVKGEQKASLQHQRTLEGSIVGGSEGFRKVGRDSKVGR
jgi:hypothetical protein